jgi:hypothetical protein
MTQLESVERDVEVLQESLRLAQLALSEPSLSAEMRDRVRATIDLYERHLHELLAVRDDLRSLAED